jgi:uncharacterized protein
MWIVNAADGGEVKALIEADPLWDTGIRKSYRIAQWRPVFGEFTSNQ